MRLNKYLIEANEKMSAEDVFNDIKIKCKSYLTLLNGKEPLFRGIHDTGDAKVTFEKQDEPGEFTNRSAVTATGMGYGIKKVRKDRIPKGTNKTDFKLVNKWLEGNGHSRRDKSISTTTSEFHSSVFGKSSWIFPIGKFKYTWVKSPDFNHSNMAFGYQTADWDSDSATIWEFVRAYYQGTLDSRTEKANLAKFVTSNKGFDEAYRKGYEIWIECNQYYYILQKNKDGFKYEWKHLKGYL